MASDPFSLAEVLAVADIHPFYNRNVVYPPDADAVQSAREQAAKEQSPPDISSRQLILKSNLYEVINRLTADADPLNTFRDAVYVSITGGGLGKQPLIFATDVHENRRHRANWGRFLASTGLIERGDWVLTTHASGHLYRSLDLTLETMENAGASALSGGDHMSPSEVVQLLIAYQVNVLSGDSSQIVQVVHHISGLSSQERARLKVTKIIYTSEDLNRSQRAYIRATLGSVKICSVLGSAEAGPWAIGNPDLTGTDNDADYADFIFDARTMLIEVLPVEFTNGGSDPHPVADGDSGVIVQTSLSRLRNPVVRYVTGDIGSLHPVPERARALVPEADWPHLRLIRLQGRSRQLSFNWDGNYLEFEHFANLINDEECGVLQWQIILDKMPSSPVSFLQVRLLCCPESRPHLLSRELLIERIHTFFHVYAQNENRFRLVFLDDLSGFERSSTGRKVMKFVDRFN